MSYHLWSNLHLTTDPVRLRLPSSPQTLNSIIPAPGPGGFAQVSLLTEPRGTLSANTEGSPGTNYSTTVGAWWGRVGGIYAITDGGCVFPGSLYQAQLQNISGTLVGSVFGQPLNTWLDGQDALNWSFELFSPGTMSGTVRLMYRRKGTTITLSPTCDFNITVTLGP